MIHTRRVLFFLVLYILVFQGAFGANDRLKHIGTSNILFPTGVVRSSTDYLTEGSHNMVSYSQKVPGNLMEVSWLRHLNGKTKDTTIMNLKLHVLEEDTFFPTVVWGVSDVQEKAGSRVFFAAASKSIETFGVTLHGGVIKDPVTTAKKAYYGLEKTILPLVSVSGETSDGESSLALNLRPYPGINLLIGQTGLKKGEGQPIYKFQYFIPF